MQVQNDNTTSFTIMKDGGVSEKRTETYFLPKSVLLRKLCVILSITLVNFNLLFKLQSSNAGEGEVKNILHGVAPPQSMRSFYIAF